MTTSAVERRFLSTRLVEGAIHRLLPDFDDESTYRPSSSPTPFGALNAILFPLIPLAVVVAILALLLVAVPVDLVRYALHREATWS